MFLKFYNSPNKAEFENFKNQSMKKCLVFLFIYLWLISCSKPSNNDSDQTPIHLLKDNVSLLTNRDFHVQDSLDKIFLAKYLDYTPLTQYEKDSITKSQIPNSPKGMVVYDWPEYTDWSGWIHIKVREQSTTGINNLQDLAVDLPEDWVLVGGGAEVIIPESDICTSNGAFITASYPYNNGWRGKSKAHALPYEHNLRVYAIGMKIAKDGFVYDPAELRSNIVYNSTDWSSIYSDLPQTLCYIPDGYQLIGGGGLDENLGYGNMLIESYPNSAYPFPGSNWYVKGKAHKRSAPSRIKAYAIGIRDIEYPGVGYIQTVYTNLVTYMSEGYCSPFAGPLFCDMRSILGYALTCPGGRVTYKGWGRMIMEIWPNSLGSNDCSYSDSGENHAIGLGIEKKPSK